MGEELRTDKFHTKSPTPVRVEGKEMNFPDAIREVMNGKLITRTSWADKEEYGYVLNGWLSIHTKGKDHLWNVNDGDLSGIDWVVIEE